MRFALSGLSAILLAAAAPAPAPWSPQPWLDDLSQARQAFRTKYANLEWLEKDREQPIAALFDRAASRFHTAQSDADAKAIFDRLIQRVGDGHVSISWPEPPSPPARAGQPETGDVCRSMGFDASRSTPGIGARLRGYRPIEGDNPFPAGLAPVGRRQIGVIRIGVFEPESSPAVCLDATRALHIAEDKACDDKCQDAILTWSYNRITAKLEEQVGRLKAAGASALLVDITGNGGGSEWAEAAARIVSPRSLVSERRGYVRGPHWAGQWRTLAAQLRAAAVGVEPLDRARLASWAAEAEAAQRDAERGCAVAAACALVGRAGYATGLVGGAPAGAFAGKPWADLVFSIAQFPYHDSVWRGPLLVLVDDETWSAAEQFAAILQDNHAAILIGARTGGAGCGHTNGGTPTVLGHSGATLELPDCARFRADGSNEVAGIIPDVATGMRANDGDAFKARLIAAGLPDAVERAFRQRSAAR